MRRARWKRKNVRDELTGKAVNSPKTGAGRHELPTELETPLPAALYLNLKSVRRRISGHGAQRGANRTSSASLSAAAPPSCPGRGFQRGGTLPSSPVPLGVGFQRRGPRPPAFVSLGVQGEVETPWCFSSGVWGGFFSRKECAPRPCGGNRPLREQETMRKRTAMPCAFSLAEIMTAARRNSKLFVKGNDRFDLMKANFVT